MSWIRNTDFRSSLTCALWRATVHKLNVGDSEFKETVSRGWIWNLSYRA
jgi:hypothetical protein